MNFGKFEKDVKDIFESKVKPFEKLSENEKIKYSLDLNYVMRKILNSYYFEKMYNVSLMKSKINDKTLFYLKVPYQNNSNHKEYRNNGFFFNEFDHLDHSKSITSEIEKLSHLSLDIIEELPKKDKIYEILFETNQIRQSLYLKERHSIQFEILDIPNINHETEISKLQKFGMHIDDHSGLKLEILSDSMKQYGFELFALSGIHMQKLLIVAHNNNEICGVSGISNYGYSGLNYLSYVEVSPSFRGQELGKRLFTEIVKYTESKNEILEMSKYTELGLNHLMPVIKPIIDSSENIIDIDTSLELQNVFSLINKKDLELKVKENLIKDIVHQFKNNNVSFKNMSYTDISDVIDVTIEKIQNNFKNTEFVPVEEPKQNNKIRNIIKSLFN